MRIATRGAQRARGRTRRAIPGAGLVLAATLIVALATVTGCGTSHPHPIRTSALEEAQTFPYFPVYWVGRSFEGQPLAAVDGRRTYLSTVGESVYYGDCSHEKGIFGGGSCLLPLQVTTVVWRLHTNASLGAQHNLLIRGVPAAAYDGGRSIELYTGQVAVDIFSDTPERALRAALRLVPLNAHGSAAARLPEPVYCPELIGPMDTLLEAVLNRLPGHICQRARAAKEIKEKLS
jgi:hypothetical protein